MMLLLEQLRLVMRRAEGAPVKSFPYRREVIVLVVG